MLSSGSGVCTAAWRVEGNCFVPMVFTAGSGLGLDAAIAWGCSSISTAIAVSRAFVSRCVLSLWALPCGRDRLFSFALQHWLHTGASRFLSHGSGPSSLMGVSGAPSRSQNPPQGLNGPYSRCSSREVARGGSSADLARSVVLRQHYVAFKVSRSPKQ